MADGHDETVVDAPFRWRPTARISGLRVGYVASEFTGRLDSANADPRLLADALDVFRSMGRRLSPSRCRSFQLTRSTSSSPRKPRPPSTISRRSKGVDQLTEQGPGAWPNSFRTSRFIPAVSTSARSARERCSAGRWALMATVDVFLAPARGSDSLPITNLTGQPAVCLTNGFVNGLPQALMITGRLNGEATLLRVALAYERATKWRTMRPNMDLVIG